MHSTLSTDSPLIQDLLSRNHSFAKSFRPQSTPAKQTSAATFINPVIASNSTGTTMPTKATLNPPATSPKPNRMCIITCCDPRVVPEYIFNLSLGEVVVLRTAGGSLAPALTSLLAIDHVAPVTDVVVMRHTDCGTARLTNYGVRMALKERCCDDESMALGRCGERLGDMGFGESVGNMGDLGLLREDVMWLRGSPLVRQETRRRVVGMVYSVETGEVKVVC